MKKFLKKLIVIILIILFLFIVLFGINLFRNNYILDKMIDTYKNEYSNKTNYYEKSDLKYTFIGEGKWNVIHELWVKDGIYLLKYTNQILETDDDKVEYTYWYNSITGEDVIVDSEGNLSIEAKPIIDEFQTYVMRITEEGKLVYLMQNMFNIITVEDGYYKIKQNNEGYYLLVNKDTFVIEKRIDSNGNIYWECDIKVDSVKDENVKKPKTTDINLNTLVEDII